MPKKHTHHLAMRVKPRPPLLEAWCPGCGEGMYTVEPTSDAEVEMVAGALVVDPKKKGKKGKRGR